ncbi:MAG: hypothetical protein AAB525_04235 [Patescibacteria group bacterium]
MKKKNLIIIIAIIALIIIIVLVRGRKEQEPAVENSEALPDAEEQIPADENVEIPVSPINGEEAEEVEIDLDNLNAEEDAGLDTLENEANKLDVSGNDEDLNLEEEIAE